MNWDDQEKKQEEPVAKVEGENVDEAAAAPAAAAAVEDNVEKEETEAKEG